MSKGYMPPSQRDDWGTPPELFAELHREFDFTVDGAANESNHLLPRWWGPGGETCDALSHNWRRERIFINPPYGLGLKDWVAKAAGSVTLPACRVVMLLPARTDTRWFHDFIYERYTAVDRHSIRFLKGRLKFVGAAGSAPFPSMIVVY